MTSSDVKKTSNIANVRIYVEQAIKRMKELHILIFNDIASLVNSKNHYQNKHNNKSTEKHVNEM